jgi:hypothetical protein
MKTTALIAMLLVGLTMGCAKKKQVMQSPDECIAAKDAAMRAAATCEKCCATPTRLQK